MVVVVILQRTRGIRRSCVGDNFVLRAIWLRPHDLGLNIETVSRRHDSAAPRHQPHAPSAARGIWMSLRGNCALPGLWNVTLRFLIER